jgi:ABC-type multidrug transport system fused ATPase/permease subunit
VDFLEFDLVYVIEAVYNFFGSLIFLFFLNTSVVLLCLSMLLPVILLSKTFGKRMLNLNKQKNDELEQQVDIISSGDRKAMHAHYNNLRKWQIRISNQEAWNFGLMELVVMVILSVSVLLTYKMSGAVIAIGSNVGFFLYLNSFTKSLDTIPYTLQRLTSLTDITRRIELQMEDFPEDTNNLKPVRKGKNKRVKMGEMAA